MIDNLKDAIAHAREVAKERNETANLTPTEYGDYINSCRECATEHEQLAAWLEELAERREADKWIPVSERLPDDLEPVNITWINHDPEPYYKEMKDKPFTATGVYFNGQWYWWSTLCTDTLAEYSHNFDDVIDASIEITHWKALPEPHESEDNK